MGLSFAMILAAVSLLILVWALWSLGGEFLRQCSHRLDTDRLRDLIRFNLDQEENERRANRLARRPDRQP